MGRVVYINMIFIDSNWQVQVWFIPLILKGIFILQFFCFVLGFFLHIILLLRVSEFTRTKSCNSHHIIGIMTYKYPTTTQFNRNFYILSVRCFQNSPIRKRFNYLVGRIRYSSLFPIMLSLLFHSDRLNIDKVSLNQKLWKMFN